MSVGQLTALLIALNQADPHAMFDFKNAPLPDGYLPKQPFWTLQQRECFEKLLDKRRSFLELEPRCGKSKCIVDKTCFYFERKSNPLHVNGLLVISFPNGVHRGWVTDAFPENVPDRIKWLGLIWRADKCRQVSFQKDLEAVCNFKGLALLSINVESLSSMETKKAIGKFLSTRKRVFVVFDESSALVNSDALRAKVMRNIGQGAVSQFVVMMADLDGTPVDKKGPFDYWSQVGWMGDDLLGYPNEVEFKKHFAVFQTFGRSPFWAQVKEIKTKLIKEGVVKPEFLDEAAIRLAKGNRKELKRGRDWWVDVAQDESGNLQYRNMEELWKKLEPITYRATFEKCFPDAKRHIYSPRYFELTEKQRTAYDELKKKYITQVDDLTIKAEHPLTRMLRCQQITSNYYPAQESIELHLSCGGLGCDACEGTGTIETEIPMKVIDPDRNPRMEALQEELKAGKPAVLWCRFTQDVDSCLELAKRMGINACRYDGKANHDQKADARDGFQSGKYDVIAGNEMSLSRGIPLWRAPLMVAVSNMFSYRTRKQVEDRSRHGAKNTATAIVDLIANDTVDDLSILPALRQGHDVSTFVLQDDHREWI